MKFTGPTTGSVYGRLEVPPSIQTCRSRRDPHDSGLGFERCYIGAVRHADMTREYLANCTKLVSTSLFCLCFRFRFLHYLDAFSFFVRMLDHKRAKRRARIMLRRVGVVPRGLLSHRSLFALHQHRERARERERERKRHLQRHTRNDDQQVEAMSWNVCHIW